MKKWTSEDDILLKKIYSDSRLDFKYFENKFNRSWGAIQARAHKLGIKRFEKIDEEIITKDLHEIAKKLGDFPSIKVLAKNNFGLKYSLLSNTIASGGILYFRRKLGFLEIRKPPNYWKKWQNLGSELRSNFSALITGKICPIYSQINFKLGSSCVKAIKKYHGGIKAIAEKLNCVIMEYYECRDGHIVDSSYELIVDEYMYSRGIKHEIHVPVKQYFTDFKLDKKFIEVWGWNTKDKTLLGKKYNKNRNRKELFYKNNAINFYSIEGSVFNNYYYNFKKIENHLDEFFKNMGYPIVVKESFTTDILLTRGIAWTDEKLIIKLLDIQKEIKRFPTTYDLEKRNLYTLIRRHGGLGKFSKLCGVTANGRTQRIKWNDDLIKIEIKKIIDDIGYFPSLKKIREISSYLAYAIYKSDKKFIEWKQEITGIPFVITDEILKLKLQEIKNKLSKFPTYKIIKKDYSYLWLFLIKKSTKTMSEWKKELSK